MTCERHCEECAKERRYAREHARYDMLTSLPTEHKRVRWFAWFPRRLQPSGSWVWLRFAVKHYETQVYYEPSIRTHVRRWALKSITLASGGDPV